MIQEEQLATVYPAIKRSGFERIVAEFYRRVADDPILRPLYPENDWEGAEERLLGFLLFRFGGDSDYLLQRGHPRLRMRHAPFAIDKSVRDRWFALMSEAITQSAIDKNAAAILRDFFDSTASFLINRVSS